MTLRHLRPMSTGELLDRTFSLYRSHFLLFVGIMALPQLIALGSTVLLQQFAPAEAPTATSPASPGWFVASTLFVVCASLVAYALAEAATIFAVSEVHLGRTTTIRQAYGRVRGKIWRLLCLIIVIALCMMLGFILLIIPGILVLLWYAVAVPAAMIEDLKVIEAMTRSEKLTKGFRGRIFLVYVLFLILSFVASFVFAFPLQIAQAIVEAPWLALVSPVGTFAAEVVVGPILTIALSLVYFDLRVRKEAFDLQLMMAALHPQSPAPSPSGS